MRRRYVLALAVLIFVGLCTVVWRSSRGKKEIVTQSFTILKDKFRCTIYYTPRETGFSESGGFNLSMETRQGLHGQRYAHDFLLAVEKEGFGKLKEPYQGMAYIRYWNGSWDFAKQPVDHFQRPLVPKASCAVSV